jgi:hypothetical protein
MNLDATYLDFVSDYNMYMKQTATGSSEYHYAYDTLMSTRQKSGFDPKYTEFSSAVNHANAAIINFNNLVNKIDDYCKKYPLNGIPAEIDTVCNDLKNAYSNECVTYTIPATSKTPASPLFPRWTP